MKPGQEETVEIEALAYGGEGLGHIQKKVVFVPFTSPGDRVRVRISESKRNYLRGTFVEFEIRSPLRAVPLCDVFGECGGCHWQHIQYEFQVEAKAKILRDTLSRIGKVDPSAYEWLPPIPAETPYGYRCRARLQCQALREVVLGFCRSRSRDIVPFGRCELLSPFLNQTIQKLSGFLNSLEYLYDFTEIEVLANPESEEAVLAFQTPSSLGDGVTDFLKALKAHIPKVYGVTFEILDGDQRRTEDFGNCGLDLRLPALDSSRPAGEIRAKARIHTFTQANLNQNANLQRVVFEWAQPRQDQIVLDIYSGMGNLTLPLASRVGRVIGLENNPCAVEDARQNALRNGLDRCDYRLADAASGLETVRAELGRVDVAIVDPPRKGASREVVAKLVALAPSRVIYVSCNPTTLARDVEMFSFSGYKLARVRMIDMFPQTYHIECVAEFVPR